jgi:hypothetical protein
VADAFAGRRHVVTTAVEHPATARVCDWLEKHGWRVTRVGVDADGRARVDQARTAVGNDTALVTVMHSNNETGALRPVAELAWLARPARRESLQFRRLDVVDDDVDNVDPAPEGVGCQPRPSGSESPLAETPAAGLPSMTISTSWAATSSPTRTGSCGSATGAVGPTIARRSTRSSRRSRARTNHRLDDSGARTWRWQRGGTRSRDRRTPPALARGRSEISVIVLSGE